MSGSQNEPFLSVVAQKTFWGEPLIIQNHGVELRANLHLPPPVDVGKRYPAVALLHGLSGDRNEAFGLFIKISAELALRDMVVLRFDSRGAGETGGSTLDITLHTLSEDLTAAVEFLRAHPLVDNSRLGLLGLSMGGLVGACLAGARDDIAALCLWEAPLDLLLTMTRLLGPYTVKSVRAKGYVQAGVIQLGPGFFEALEGFDAAEIVRDYRRPVLIVHGTADNIVPVETANQWKRSFTRTEAEVFLVDGGDHAFTRDAWSWPAVQKSAEWFALNL